MVNKELIEAIKPIRENFGLTKEQYDDIVAPYQILLLEALKQQSGKFMIVDVNKIPEDFNEEEFLKIAKNQGLQIFQSEPTLEEAIKVLQKHLSEDKSEGSYYYSWQANIAMSIYDEYCRQKGDKDYEESRVLDIHEICNTGAKNFLNLLINK